MFNITQNKESLSGGGGGLIIRCIFGLQEDEPINGGGGGGLISGSLRYAEKAELSKCFWYPRRKMGVTIHFSEIIKLQYGKNAMHCFVFYCFL